MDAAKLDDLVEILDKIGLPILGIPFKSAGKKRELNLSSILAGTKKYISLDYLFTLDIETDSKNRSVNQITISKPRGTSLFPM